MYDLVIKGARVFDGTGAPAVDADVAVHDGQVAAVGPDLQGDTVIDGAGCWLMPGLLDVHTHYDLEVELAPGLTESLRHGTTTVVMSNCSLGLAFGHQRHTGHDPVVSCFARVENLPKEVLARVADDIAWTDPRSYLEHLHERPLGPNVVPMIPHSMLRVEVMGLPDAIEREPTAEELARMCAIVEAAMEDGYVGLSTDALPFHYLANDPYRAIKIPTQHATFGELRALTEVVRTHGRVWQTTPPKDDPLDIVKAFALTSGRLYGRPLKLTSVAAMELVPNRWLFHLGKVLTGVLNSTWMQGHFRLQSLAVPFRVWADGPITPLSEEIDVLRELNEPDLDDVDARRTLLNDPAYRERFRAWWYEGKRGLSVASLRRWLVYEDSQLTRELVDMVVESAPVGAWAGENLAQIHARGQQFQRTGDGARSEAEAEALGAMPADEAEFLLWLLDRYDRELCWWCVSANPDRETARRVALDERFMPGFSDSGAHLANMAFYDVNLRSLQYADEDGEAAVARMVQRLTREPAEFFGVDAGRLEVGAVADLTLIDPVALRAYDSDAAVACVTRPEIGHRQRVNRSDGVVRAVWIGGRLAWADDGPAEGLGRVKMGRCLTAV